MELSNGYFIAWGIYALAVVMAQLLFWRLCRSIAHADLRLVLQFCLFALLVTPARLEQPLGYWAPAFMAALMDGLNYGLDQVLERLWPVLVSLLLLLLGRILWTRLKARRGKA